jgi:hypothetical protein
MFPFAVAEHGISWLVQGLSLHWVGNDLPSQSSLVYLLEGASHFLWRTYSEHLHRGRVSFPMARLSVTFVLRRDLRRMIMPRKYLTSCSVRGIYDLRLMGGYA